MSTWLLSLEMSTRLLSPSHSLKARDERVATFSGDEHKATLPLISRQEMSTRLLSLEMSTRLLSPSHSLKTRDEHKATFSGDEHKATFSLSFSQGKR